ncbi:hypothetical protein SVAN01_07053 [Stagonosporopsis vannaccii]|nr:hypothetical protein SVAN01_07053 [Stagonosporopsis vannaccii]
MGAAGDKRLKPVDSPVQAPKAPWPGRLCSLARLKCSCDPGSISMRPPHGPLASEQGRVWPEVATPGSPRQGCAPSPHRHRRASTGSPRLPHSSSTALHDDLHPPLLLPLDMHTSLSRSATTPPYQSRRATASSPRDIS